MSLTKILPSYAALLVVVLLGLLSTACSPATPLAPTPTPLPPIPSTTSAPPNATATSTATLTPTAAPTASATATLVPPTDTPTPLPTDTPPPTITRAPTRRPIDTPAPAVVAPPVCPAWYQPPQPEKGVLVIANESKFAALIESLPGYPSPLRVDGSTNGEPVRVTVHLAPGQYRFSFGSDGGGGELVFAMSAGEMKVAQLFMQTRSSYYECYAERSECPFGRSTQWVDALVGRLDIPYGCPGGLPPTPTPRPQCPAWYATPAPDKAILVIENRSSEAFDVLTPDGGPVIAKAPRNGNELPGYVSIALAPGHYEFQTTTGKRIVVDLAAGMSVVAVHPETRWGPDLLLAYGLNPPPACPGYTPPTPTPAPQCPDWFQRPQPGKGVLIIENYAPRFLTVVGVKGINVDYVLQKPNGDKIDRLILQLNPGQYEFSVLLGAISADVSEGQVYAFAITEGVWLKRAATVYMPPACQ